MSAARDKLAAGRLKACKLMPYFRAALVSLVPKEAPGLGTFGVTDGGVLMWDPEQAAAWSADENAGVLLHEVSHILRKHRKRKPVDMPQETWNIFCDLEINDDLRAAGVRLPPDGLYPSTFGFPDGLTAEEYAAMAKKQAKKVQVKGKAGAGSGKCGSCAGNPHPGEAEADGEGKRTEAELERVRKQVAEAVRSAAAKGRGSVPADLLRWADEQLAPPKIDWRAKMARILRGSLAYCAGAVDLRYHKASRRQAGLGYGPGRAVLPTYVAPCPRVAVAVDTSGSMSDTDLSMALSEVEGILRATGARVELVACDAAATEPRVVRNVREAAASLRGGGGTDFRPAIAAFEKRRERPDLLVYLTDGDGTAPKEAPPFRVVWGLIGHNVRSPAKWGETVEIEAAS